MFYKAGVFEGIDWFQIKKSETSKMNQEKLKIFI